jgi:2,4-dienoyl-CoA reductase-like NADH-dependent reductase (Old Yellow Enzyme family)
MNDDIVFSPFTIKNHTIRNRLGVAPMTRMSSPADSIPRQDVLDFLVRRAENGAGIVYTEGIVTDYESSQGYPGQGRILTQRQIDAWRIVAEKIKRAGALAMMQLFHCGRVSMPDVNPAGRIIAPSPVAPRQNNPFTGEPYAVPDEMSEFDIRHVINGFVESARGAMAAGFDGVELHGAHGYLINQFLSAYSNKRVDAYGGSLEDRFRLARELIHAVREVVPEDRLLVFRISNWGVVDREVNLFADEHEWQHLIKLLAWEDLDALSVSTYNFRDQAFGTDQTMARLTRDMTDLPLMICGQIYDYDSAARALEDADIALSAKSFLLNPDWVGDMRARKELPRFRSEDANRAYGDEALP